MAVPTGFRPLCVFSRLFFRRVLARRDDSLSFGCVSLSFLRFFLCCHQQQHILFLSAIHIAHSLICFSRFFVFVVINNTHGAQSDLFQSVFTLTPDDLADSFLFNSS